MTTSYGIVWDVLYGPQSYRLGADEVIYAVRPDSNGINAPYLGYLTEAWFAITNGSGVDLNVPTAMQLLRVGGVGIGGTEPAAGKPRELNIPIGTHDPETRYVGDDGFATPPGVVNTFGGPKPFNLGEGFFWSAHESGPYVVKSSASDYFGMRLIAQLPAGLTWQAGISISQI
jgi:hypothetical protein